MNKSVKYMNAFKTRILYFLKIHAKKGQTRFEEYCGLSRSTINNIKDGISTASVYKIAEKYPELNLNWLIAGDGEMLKDTETTALLAQSNTSAYIELLKKDLEERDERLKEKDETIVMLKKYINTLEENKRLHESSPAGEKPGAAKQGEAVRKRKVR
jgi:transcriptional regulator with XRE-family HTH domain